MLPSPRLTFNVKHGESDYATYEAEEIMLYPPFVVENDVAAVIRIKPVKADEPDDS